MGWGWLIAAIVVFAIVGMWKTSRRNNDPIYQHYLFKLFSAAEVTDDIYDDCFEMRDFIEEVRKMQMLDGGLMAGRKLAHLATMIPYFGNASPVVQSRAKLIVDRLVRNGVPNNRQVDEKPATNIDKKKQPIVPEHVLNAINHTLVVLHNCFVHGTADGTMGRRLWGQGHMSEDEVPLVNAFVGGLYEAFIEGIVNTQNLERSGLEVVHEYKTLASMLFADKPMLYLFSELPAEPDEALEWIMNGLHAPQDRGFFDLGHRIGTEHIQAMVRNPQDPLATSPNIAEFKKRLMKRKSATARKRPAHGTGM